MIGEAIHDTTLKALVSQHAIREAVVGRVQGGGRPGRWRRGRPRRQSVDPAATA